MSSSEVDVAVVGAGIVGLSTARALRARGSSLVVLEARPSVGTGQTGRNSGVVHSGLYYAPGSEKARTCVQGSAALLAYCAERGIRHRRCGKLLLALDDRDRAALGELERRGRANGLRGVRRINEDETLEREPHAAAAEALLVPETGVVDFRDVARSLASELTESGVEIRLGATLRRASYCNGMWSIEVAGATDPVRARSLIACAGLDADRVARRCGVEPDLRIVPFRGDYYSLRPDRADLVRALIYPVPDPALPFLGVHVTRRIDDTVEAGPNARAVIGWRALSWPGFWRMVVRHRRAASAELLRASSRRRFAAEARRLLPELRDDDLTRAPSGTRAQALRRDGTLVDDFHVVRGPASLHVLNAPSPAATASLAIGERLAAQLVSIERVSGRSLR